MCVPHHLNDDNDVTELRVELENGFAHRMGDGLFILFHTEAGNTSSLVLTTDDLKAMLEAG